MKRKINYNILGNLGKTLVTIPLMLAVIAISVTSGYKLPVRITKADMNSDGFISNADVEAILKLSSGNTAIMTPEIFLKADMNSDGIITSAGAYLAATLMSSSVIINYEDVPETTTPLVNNSFTSTGTIPVISENGAYNVINNQKMYIYPDLSQVMQMRDTFIIISFGWGHGVGMSQTGANYMAKEGHTYKEILSHYYTDIEFSKL